MDNLYKQREVYVSTANMYTIFPFWDVSMSYDFQWNEMKADMYGFVFPTRFTNLLSIATALRLGKVKLQGSGLATFVNDRVKEGPAPKARQILLLLFFFHISHLINMILVYEHSIKKHSGCPLLMTCIMLIWETPSWNPEYVTQYNLGTVYQKQWGNKLFRHFKIQRTASYN